MDSIDYGWPSTNNSNAGNMQAGLAPTGQGSGTPPAPTPATPNYLPWLQLILNGASAYASYSSAKQANQKNVQLQREQQAWEERMAGTAIQRRKADIELAGGNPALAFTGGEGAATPNLAPAHVDPINFPQLNVTGAMMAKAQLANINADTMEKQATARSKAVQADIDEAAKGTKTSYTVNHYLEAYEWDDLKTKITRSQDVSSAAEAKRLNETVDSVISLMKQQARTGAINLDALENVAKLAGGDQTIWSAILKYAQPFLLKMAQP